MALRGIQEYIAKDVNNIVSIEGNIFLYSPKTTIQYYYHYSYRALCFIYLMIVGDCRLPFCHRTKWKASGT